MILLVPHSDFLLDVACRVLKAPGGGSSNIFGGYVEEEQREQQDRRQRETNAVMQSNQVSYTHSSIHQSHQYINLKHYHKHAVIIT